MASRNPHETSSPFEQRSGRSGRERRLVVKDYEVLPETEEAWIYLAMSRLMVARLAR